MGKCKANTDRLRGYRIRIYPSEVQKQIIHKTIDTTRFVYNLALSIENYAYELGKKFISYYSLCSIFSELQKSDLYPWLSDIPISTIRQALYNLNNAFKKFFNKETNYPKYHSKKTSKKSFQVRAERTYIQNGYISISGIGYVSIKTDRIPIHQRIYSPTITYTGYDEYWFSCCMEVPEIDMSSIPQSDPIGIDVGIRNMITTSDGEYYHFSDTSKFEKRLKRQQRRLSKDYKKYLDESIHTKTKYEDVPKSKNHYKRLFKQHKSYSKIHNKKFNDINVATKAIVSKNPSAIVIEDLSVTEQLKDKWIRQFSPKMLFNEIHRQIVYKAEDRNIPVIKADKNFPSSQICSNCGMQHKVYRNKVFKCPYCGFRIDRDLNAAINLKNLAYQLQ